MVVGRSAAFAKRRQSIAVAASRPAARRPAQQPKAKRPQSEVGHKSSDSKSASAEASSSSVAPRASATTASTSAPNQKLSTGSQASAAAPIKRKDATTVGRRSTDFSNIVLEAARRASTSGNRGGTDSDIEAALTDSIRERKLRRQPSIEEVAETESTVSVGSLFTKQYFSSLIENSPKRRRGVNIGDHKTCALLMEKMKVAARGSPS